MLCVPVHVSGCGLVGRYAVYACACVGGARVVGRYDLCHVRVSGVGGGGGGLALAPPRARRRARPRPPPPPRVAYA